MVKLRSEGSAEARVLDLSQEGQGDEEEILGGELQFRGLRLPVLSPRH